jgi:uncharacterized protein YkwD
MRVRIAPVLILCAALAATPVALLAAPAVAKRASPIAPASACPHQTELAAPLGAQLKAMLCMTNHARRAEGLKPLLRSRPLAKAAAHKSADVLRCDEFSHEACGREFTFWMQRFGYLHGCWSVGENIGFATGDLGTVRQIFVAWMHSSGHRANILGEFGEIGIGRGVGTLEGSRGAVVWTEDFGSHGC